MRAGWRPVQEFNCSGALRVGESPPPEPKPKSSALRPSTAVPRGVNGRRAPVVCVCVCVRVCVQGEEQRGRGSILDFGK